MFYYFLIDLFYKINTMNAAEKTHKAPVGKQIDGRVTCPYDRNHREEPANMMHHLLTCSGNSSGTYRCPFNAKHHFVCKDEFQNHLNVCNGYYGINKMLYQESCNIKKTQVSRNKITKPKTRDSLLLKKHTSFSIGTKVPESSKTKHPSTLPLRRVHYRRKSSPAGFEITKMQIKQFLIPENVESFSKSQRSKNEATISLESQSQNIVQLSAGKNLYRQSLNSSSSANNAAPELNDILPGPNIENIPLLDNNNSDETLLLSKGKSCSMKKASLKKTISKPLGKYYAKDLRMPLAPKNQINVSLNANRSTAYKTSIASIDENISANTVENSAKSLVIPIKQNRLSKHDSSRKTTSKPLGENNSQVHDTVGSLMPKDKYLIPVKEITCISEAKPSAKILDSSLLPKGQILSLSKSKTSSSSSKQRFHPYKESVKKQISLVDATGTAVPINEKTSELSKQFETSKLLDSSNVSTDLSDTSMLPIEQISSMVKINRSVIPADISLISKDKLLKIVV